MWRWGAGRWGWSWSGVGVGVGVGIAVEVSTVALGEAKVLDYATVVGKEFLYCIAIVASSHVGLM